ncbi:hypothetical protein MKX01_039606 [Papaver californicum]|nr:hypothetical protein MKX01_039606 [Papaver californicum]
MSQKSEQALVLLIPYLPISSNFLSGLHTHRPGPTIVQEAKKQGVSLLILGQRKRTITWRLLQLWRRKRSSSSGVVGYCIENANCMAIGYLITTRHHKDFWVLA